MTPEERKLLNDLQGKVVLLESKVFNVFDSFFRLNLIDKFLLEKPLVMRNTYIKMSGKIMQKKGVDVISASDLILGNDGNTFSITGNTTINAITIGTWQSGSEVNLIFTGTPTLKHNTAGSTGTAKMFLLGSVDCVTVVNNTIFTFVYDGTVWQEKSRKIA